MGNLQGIALNGNIGKLSGGSNMLGTPVINYLTDIAGTETIEATAGNFINNVNIIHNKTAVDIHVRFNEETGVNNYITVPPDAVLNDFESFCTSISVTPASGTATGRIEFLYTELEV